MNAHLAGELVEVHVFDEVQARGDCQQVRHFPVLSLTSLPTTQLQLARDLE
jgi:hypothetical protein